MTRDDALAILFDNRQALQQRGVVRAAIFGSTVRGDTRPGSDVDVLVDIDPAANIGVYEYVASPVFWASYFQRPLTSPTTLP